MKFNPFHRVSIDGIMTWVGLLRSGRVPGGSHVYLGCDIILTNTVCLSRLHSVVLFFWLYAEKINSSLVSYF